MPYELWLTLADLPWMRHVLDVFFSARARLYLVWLQRLQPARAQRLLLRRLIRTHCATPFGLAHDFARIRAEADFRRLVPLQPSQELPWTAQRLAIHRQALRAALALAVQHCPRRTRLLTRPLVWLGEESHRQRSLPRLLQYLAHTATTGEVGCAIGPASRVAPWLAHADACISWEDGTPAVGVELLVRPEGTIAVRAPHQPLFRLLVDHGMYFEFVPAEDRSHPQPRRLTWAEVQPGLVYELVVSSPVAWARRTGLGIVFEPTLPLFHRVNLPPLLEVQPVESVQVSTSPTLPQLPSLGGMLRSQQHLWG
ncbi:MAG: GH3 auxin-responsive promoter family protein [Gemmataceae bacterium]